MKAAQVIQALGDPTRRTIFERLGRAPASVGELAGEMPVSRPAVSQHLKVLKSAGLVTEHREGVRRVYQVELRGLVELRRYVDDLWGDALNGFERAARQQQKRGDRR